MTTYGAVNRIWTAGNYDLCTTDPEEGVGVPGRGDRLVGDDKR